MKKTRIYISGKISGLPRRVYMRHFSRVEMILKAEGNSVINPAKTVGTLPEDTTYEQCMDMCMMMLSFCDTIYMLRGWQDSPGANREYKWAVEHGLSVMREDE